MRTRGPAGGGGARHQDRVNDLIRILLRFPFLRRSNALSWDDIECGP